ncbi:GNAT family N-acetyltransferase [Paenibacillus tarimensis]
MEFRAVTPADDSFLYALYSDARRDEVTAWGWDASQADAFLRMQWSAQNQSYAMHYPDAVHLIIVFEGQDTGRVVIHYGIESIRLVDIAVMSRHRNRGIGVAVMRHLQREAELAELPVHLSVTSGNPAKRLYERLGFECVNADASDLYIAMRWEPGHKMNRKKGAIE